MDKLKGSKYMPKRRPEREQIEAMILDKPRMMAADIAQQVGLIQKIGYDKAVAYVRGVKKSLRKQGDIPSPDTGSRTTDEDRLEDLNRLFEMRIGKEIDRKVAYTMLLLNCYYRLRSEDYTTHIGAFDDTYAKNTMIAPFVPSVALNICTMALELYNRSINEASNEFAIQKGYPGAGLHYTDATFVERLQITEEEMKQLKSIKQERITR